jgi:hypothetical protein
VRVDPCGVGFDRAEAEHLNPAIESRHDGYDVEGIHVAGRSRADRE